jgi:FkbM family methyltransferase
MYADRIPVLKRSLIECLRVFLPAEGIRNKMRIIEIAALRFVGVTFGKTESIDKLEKALLKNVVVKTGNSRYAIADCRNYYIVSPEFYEAKFFDKWFSPRLGETVIDIGANIGRYTVSSSKAVGDLGVVLAVEAHPDNYRILERNVELNGLKNVMTFNLAAWDEECELNMFIGKTSGLHSAKKNRGMGQLKVKAKPVDDIVNELSLDRVDWIKIDVEGAECEVLCGLSQTISGYRPKVIIEVDIENTSEVLKFMQNLNYDLTIISPILFEENAYYFGKPR